MWRLLCTWNNEGKRSFYLEGCSKKCHQGRVRATKWAWNHWRAVAFANNCEISGHRGRDWEGVCVLGRGCIWREWGRNCGNRVLVTWCSGPVIMWPQREERKAGEMDSTENLRKTGHRPSSPPRMWPLDRVLPPEQTDHRSVLILRMPGHHAVPWRLPVCQR